MVHSKMFSAMIFFVARFCPALGIPLCLQIQACSTSPPLNSNPAKFPTEELSLDNMDFILSRKFCKLEIYFFASLHTATEDCLTLVKRSSRVTRIRVEGLVAV